MKHRARVLAALLALFAFSAAFAEQVWESACAPPAAASTMPVPGGAGGSAVHQDPGCDPDMRALAPPERHPRPPSGGDCPFQAVAACGCVLFALQAPQAALPGLARTPAARMVPASQAAPDLLLASAQFRPPQA